MASVPSVSHMSPLARYERDIAEHGFQRDPSQREAVQRLDQLYQDLLAFKPQKPSLWVRLGVKQPEPQTPITGLYFWGGVGRGKTYLMDTFYESLPFENKLRLHFHRFMRRVHQELTRFAGEKNPLDQVADRLAAEARVLCFDEFFVTDITDAMILATLLEALFARGVSLVTTSNIEPKGLYKDGLQRERFLPAITLLYEHTQVVNVDGGIDYRLRALEQAELYHWPLDEAAQASLNLSFDQLVPEQCVVHEHMTLEVEGRPLIAVKQAEDVVWFEFTALCDGPRSQNDYIELAREYHTVLLANVPVMGAQGGHQTGDDLARRFVNLVDEFYDRGVKLVISAEVGLDQLYSGGRLNFEFERTQSRLLEMQSREYLARPHLPD